MRHRTAPTTTGNCRQRVVAAGRTCRVSLCDHGIVYVDVGALTLRLSPEQLASTADTLSAACAELGDPRQETGSRLLC